VTVEEKRILLREIPKYIKKNCYFPNGAIKCYNLWLVGWVAAEFNDRRNAMRVLINNEYGLLGNLLNKLARTPDSSITQFIEQTDSEILLKAIDVGGKTVLSRNKLHMDPYAMKLLIKHDLSYANEVSSGLLTSEHFLLSVVDSCPQILKNARPTTFTDKNFVFSLIKKNHACLKYLPHKFSCDYQMCLEAARQEGFSLMYFDLKIREYDEIVLTAVSNRGNALSLATPRQKKDRNIVRTAVNNCGLALDYADPSLKCDFEIVSLAVKNRGMALRYAAPELQDCQEIVRLAVQNDGYAISSASDRLRDNRELAELAISTYTDAYKYLSTRLQNDTKIKDLYFSKKETENKWLQSKTL